MSAYTDDKSQLPDDLLRRDLDRLADGALNRDQQRALLSRLDDIPGGWRQCALAFLEGQALRGEFQGLFDKAEPATIAKPASVVKDSSSRLRRMTTIFAMAASFFLAFSLGLVIRGKVGMPIASPGSNQVAASSPVSQPDISMAIAATPAKDEDQQLALADMDDNRRDVETIWLPASGDEGELVLPAELAEELEGLGHQVNRKQELWPVELGDGRRGLLPVEQLDIHYVGHRYE